MELDEVLKALERYTRTYPREAVEAAMSMQEAITPELLRILEDTVTRAVEIEAEDTEQTYYAHMYALYLLAQFRETRAYPLVVGFARLDERLLKTIAGEFVTEDLCRVLASVCDGDLGPIKALIEDPTVYEYVRGAAVRSLVALVVEGALSRDEVIAYFKTLFDGKLEREPSSAWQALASESVHLYPDELAGRIGVAIDEELVFPWIMDPINVEDALKREKETVLEELSRYTRGYIENTVAETQWWACFDQPKRSSTFPKMAMPAARPGLPGPVPKAAPAKVGRNDPCPCGSGKKYKKCCLGAG